MGRQARSPSCCRCPTATLLMSAPRAWGEGWVWLDWGLGEGEGDFFPVIRFRSAEEEFVIKTLPRDAARQLVSSLPVEVQPGRKEGTQTGDPGELASD